MSAEPLSRREQDLRAWSSQFSGAAPIAGLEPRHPGTCVGVVERIRLVPGRTLEVTVTDGTGRLTAVFDGRATLPGLALGEAMRLRGTVSGAPGTTRTMRNPDWDSVRGPY